MKVARIRHCRHRGRMERILPCRAPHSTRESRERRKLPSRVRGGVLAENELDSF